MRVYIPASGVDTVPNWFTNLLAHVQRSRNDIQAELAKFNASYTVDKSGPDPERWCRVDFASEQDYTFCVLVWS